MPGACAARHRWEKQMAEDNNNVIQTILDGWSAPTNRYIDVEQDSGHTFGGTTNSAIYMGDLSGYADVTLHVRGTVLGYGGAGGTSTTGGTGGRAINAQDQSNLTIVLHSTATLKGGGGGGGKGGAGGYGHNINTWTDKQYDGTLWQYGNNYCGGANYSYDCRRGNSFIGVECNAVYLISGTQVNAEGAVTHSTPYSGGIKSIKSMTYTTTSGGAGGNGGKGQGYDNATADGGSAGVNPAGSAAGNGGTGGAGGNYGSSGNTGSTGNTGAKFNLGAGSGASGYYRASYDWNSYGSSGYGGGAAGYAVENTTGVTVDNSHGASVTGTIE